MGKQIREIKTLTKMYLHTEQPCPNAIYCNYLNYLFFLFLAVSIIIILKNNPKEILRSLFMGDKLK